MGGDLFSTRKLQVRTTLDRLRSVWWFTGQWVLLVTLSCTSRRESIEDVSKGSGKENFEETGRSFSPLPEMLRSSCRGIQQSRSYLDEKECGREQRPQNRRLTSRRLGLKPISSRQMLEDKEVGRLWWSVIKDFKHKNFHYICSKSVYTLPGIKKTWYLKILWIFHTFWYFTFTYRFPSPLNMKPEVDS